MWSISLLIISTINANRVLLQTTEAPIDPRSCSTNTDCEVKNVGNCCGYYPGCVHKDYTPDLQEVQQKCAEEGLSSICGWTDPLGCSCKNNQCEEIYSTNTIDTPSTTAEFENIPGCGGIDHCISYDPDGCNTCSCCDMSDTMYTNCNFDVETCTLVGCFPAQPRKCLVCLDGYDIIQGQCISSVCSLPAMSGPCEALFKRYFYNNQTQTCEEFTYGGCDGNQNNFDTKDSCVEFARQCEITVMDVSCGGFNNCVSYWDGCNTCSCDHGLVNMCTEMACSEYGEAECRTCVDGYSLSGGTCVSDDCVWPPEMGLCDADMQRYFYNSESKQCEIFWYGGCGGNANNFETETECIHQCATATATATAVPSDCLLAKKTGPCRAAFERYYYNSQTGTCDKFIYGGCQGNSNNFVTELDCKTNCVMVHNNNNVICINNKWWNLWIGIVVFIIATYF